MNAQKGLRVDRFLESHGILPFSDILQQQPHYNLWADFKATGGVIESVSYKTDAEFLT